MLTIARVVKGNKTKDLIGLSKKARSPAMGCVTVPPADTTGLRRTDRAYGILSESNRRNMVSRPEPSRLPT